MTAAEYLNRLITLDKEINNKLQRIETLREIANSTSAPNIGEKVQCSRQKSPLENIVAKIVDLDREVDSKIDELVDLKAELWELLGNMADERYRNVLWMRYTENKTMRQIAVENDRTKRHIRRLHAQALEEFRKIFEKYKNAPPYVLLMSSLPI